MQLLIAYHFSSSGSLTVLYRSPTRAKLGHVPVVWNSFMLTGSNKLESIPDKLWNFW